ncbi:MAG TPA: hypothetical protein O0X38_07890 [Methanocorpusculum sp.]|nr:hypothetical protein [Methanocorpusculum sp.]
MQLTVLVDNTTAIDKYYLGERDFPSILRTATKRSSSTADTRTYAGSMQNAWEWISHA